MRLSELPTRQETATWQSYGASAFSELPTRQETGPLGSGPGPVFSELPTRQETGSNSQKALDFEGTN